MLFDYNLQQYTVDHRAAPVDHHAAPVDHHAAPVDHPGTVTHNPDGSFSPVVAIEHRVDRDPSLAPLLLDARAAWAAQNHPGWQLAGATTDEVLATWHVMGSAAATAVVVQPSGVCWLVPWLMYFCVFGSHHIDVAS